MTQVGRESWNTACHMMDQESALFGSKVVIKDRVCIRFSEKGVGSVVGGRTGKRSLAMINTQHRGLRVMVEGVQEIAR